MDRGGKRNDHTVTAPLGSVLALDLSQNVGGAFAGSLLADFGATVLVVEQPEAGTAVRRLVAP
ncbi:MAG: CoA transferase, partial [Betaproteobacteria bacterium]